MRRFFLFFTLLASSLVAEDYLKDLFIKNDPRHKDTECYNESTDTDETCCCCDVCKPKIQRGDGIYVRGEYLFWRTWQEGLDIAGVGPKYPGKIKKLEFNWESGFRAGIGVSICDFDIEVDYTYLRPKKKKSLSSTEIFPTTSPQFISEAFSFIPANVEFAEVFTQSIFKNAKSNGSFDYNVIDIKLMGNYSPKPCFTTKGILGFQIAIFEECFGNTFAGDLDIKSDHFPFVLEEIHPFTLQTSERWKFIGGGLKFGGLGEYHSRCGFLFFGGGEFNIHFGKFNLRYRQNITALDREDTLAPDLLNIFTDYYDVLGKEKCFDFVSNIHANLGIGYETCCGCMYFRLNVSWEMEMWFGLARFRDGLSKKTDFPIGNMDFDFETHSSNPNVTPKECRNLGLQGLVVSLEILF